MNAETIGNRDERVPSNYFVGGAKCFFGWCNFTNFHRRRTDIDRFGFYLRRAGNKRDE